MSLEGIPEENGEKIKALLRTNLEGKSIEELEEIKKQIGLAYHPEISGEDAAALGEMNDDIDLLIAEQQKSEKFTESSENLPENLKEVRQELGALKEKRRTRRGETQRIAAEIQEMLDKGTPLDSAELDRRILDLRTQLKWKKLDEVEGLRNSVETRIAELEAHQVRASEVGTQVNKEETDLHGSPKKTEAEMLAYIEAQRPEFMAKKELESYLVWLHDQGVPQSADLKARIEREIAEVVTEIEKRHKRDVARQPKTSEEENKHSDDLQEGIEDDKEDLDEKELDEVANNIVAEATPQEQKLFRKILSEGWGTLKQTASGAGTSIKEIFTTKEGFYKFASGAGASAGIRVGLQALGVSSGMGLSIGVGALGGVAKKGFDVRGKRKAFEAARNNIAQSPADFIELVKKGKLHKLDAVRLFNERSVEIEKMSVEDEYDEASKMNAEFDNTRILQNIFNGFEEVENLKGIDKLEKYLDLTKEAESDEIKAQRKSLEKELALITGRKVSMADLAKAAFQGAIGGAVGNVIGGFVIDQLDIKGISRPSWLGGGSVDAPKDLPSSGAVAAPSNQTVNVPLADTAHVAPAPERVVVPGGPEDLDANRFRVETAQKLEPHAPSQLDVTSTSEVPKTVDIDLSRFKIGMVPQEVVPTPSPQLITFEELAAREAVSSIDAEHVSVGELLNKIADANVESGPELDAAMKLHELNPTSGDLNKSVAEFLNEKFPSPEVETTPYLQNVGEVRLEGTETIEVPSQKNVLTVPEHSTQASPRASIESAVTQPPSPKVAAAPLEQTMPPTNFKGPEPIPSYSSRLGKISPLGPVPLSEKSPFMEAMLDRRTDVSENILDPKTPAEKGFIDWLLHTKAGKATSVLTGLAAVEGGLYAGYKYNDRRLVRKYGKTQLSSEQAIASNVENSAEETNKVTKEAAKVISAQSEKKLSRKAEEKLIQDAQTSEQIKALTLEQKRTKIMSLLPPVGGWMGMGGDRDVKRVKNLLETKRPQALFEALGEVAAVHTDRLEDIRMAGKVALILYPEALEAQSNLNARLDQIKTQKEEDLAKIS